MCSNWATACIVNEARSRVLPPSLEKMGKASTRIMMKIFIRKTTELTIVSYMGLWQSWTKYDHNAHNEENETYVCIKINECWNILNEKKSDREAYNDVKTNEPSSQGKKRTWRSWRAWQNCLSRLETESKTGSTAEVMVPQSPLDRMKTVRHAMMQVFDSARTSFRAASKFPKASQSMTWADFMVSREAVFNPVQFRRTLLSPTTEKSRDILMKFRNSRDETRKNVTFFVLWRNRKR